MSESGIFCKIDWFSAVFNGCSINDILRWLQIDYEYDEFFSRSFSRALGYDTQVTYAFDGVSIAVSYSLINHYAVDNTDISVFDFVFDRLRLDISGSGLDAMRDKWLDLGHDACDFDDHLRQIPVLERGDMHVTRCDFAYDLIDYCPDFLDNVISYCNSVSLSGGTRLPICTASGGSLNGGYKFSVRSGDQKTVYVGSTRGDKMLRIYDKRMQLTDEDGIWLKNAGHQDCSSWIRIELQTRNGIAHGLCFGDGDFLTIFRYIYDTYAFRDLSSPSNKSSVVDFWDFLFTWEQLPQIRRNLHTVPSVPVTVRAKRFVYSSAFKSLMVLFATEGVSKTLSDLSKYLEEIQVSSDYQLQKKWASLLITLHSASSKFDSRIDCLPGLSVDNGILHLNF